MSGKVVVPRMLYDPGLLARFGQHEWEVTDNLLQGLAAVRHGDAQAMLAELYQLQYPIRNNQLSELTITELPERFGLGFAIRPEQTSLAGCWIRA